MVRMFFGEGTKSTEQTPQDFKSDADLVAALNREGGTEAWLTVSEWKGGTRERGSEWRGATGVGVDVDGRDGSPLSPSERRKLETAARGGQLPGTVFYATAHGFRLLFLLDVPAKDHEAWQRAGQGANRLVADALTDLQLADRFKIDGGVSTDGKRILYLPRTTVPKDGTGKPRSGRAVLMEAGHYSLQALAGHAPREDKEQAPGFEAGYEAAPAGGFATAAAEYNRTHTPADWPTSPRKDYPCPGCGHRGCFQAFNGGWTCFSTNHTEEHGGRRGDKNNFFGGALDFDARAAGVEPPELLRQEGLWVGGDTLSDLGNAGRLVRAAKGRFLYVPVWRSWLCWDGTRWKRDADTRVFELAAEVSEGIFAEAASAKSPEAREALSKHALRSQHRDRLRAMVSLAGEAYPNLKVEVRSLDADPYLFNVKNGTVDLRTGKLRLHSPDDLITKLADVAFDPEARAPLWRKTLREVHPDDELRNFVQRALGYCLTGDTKEEVLFFFHGDGRNGKGVITRTMFTMLGEYANAAPEDLLLWRKLKGHPTELTTLLGRRLVLATETDQGHGWGEARVKNLTGNDPISARGMRQDFYTFLPTHKLVISSNYKPRVEGNDTGIWSRIKLVPFEKQWRAPGDPRTHLPLQDENLKTKLLGELPGILTWAVEGCREWQKRGLGEPAKVRQATAEYREEQAAMDPINGFLAEFKVTHKMLLKDFATAYTKYAEIHRQKRFSAGELRKKLQDRGYTVKRGTGNKYTVVPPKDSPDSKAKQARF